MRGSWREERFKRIPISPLSMTYLEKKKIVLFSQEGIYGVRSRCGREEERRNARKGLLTREECQSNISGGARVKNMISKMQIL